MPCQDDFQARASVQEGAANAAAAVYPHQVDAETEEAAVHRRRWRPPQEGAASAEASAQWAGAANAPAASGCGSGSPRVGSS